MFEIQGLVESNCLASNRLDDSFFRLRVVLDARLKRLLDLVLPRGRRDDDAVAGLPAGDGFFERDFGSAFLRRCAELEPGATHRRAMEIHAAAAIDDRGAGFLVVAFDVMK